MTPEHLTTHALGEPLSPAEREALEQTLQTDAQARADFEATQAFTSFLQQNLTTDQPEATLTDEQKQRLLNSSGASGSLAQNEGDRAGRPTVLSWLTRAALPLSAAALIVLGFQQWHTENQSTLIPEILQEGKSVTEIREGADDVVHITQLKRNVTLSPTEPSKPIVTNSPQSAVSLPGAPPSTIGTKKDASSLASASAVMPQDPAELEKLQRSLMALPDTLPIAAPPTADNIGITSAPSPAATSAPPINGNNDDTLPGWKAPTPQLLAAVPASLPQLLTEEQAFGDTATRREFANGRSDNSTNESYTPIQENALTAVLREPLSTFSIDVDTASYANVRRFLNRSSLPPRDAVRIEELVNYFPYNLEGPAPDSPHPFAVHVEVADSPWQPQHRLARIGIQGKKVGLEERNSNFVFLVDVSGSMNQPDKLPLVKQSLRLLVEQLDEKDRVSLVTYAGSSGLVLPPTPGDQKDRILAAIANMTSGGSTHGSAGIQLAYEQAIAGFIPEGVNRVILCSDGDFNVGVSSPEELEKLIVEKARSGVFLSVLGFGTGNLKDRTMETLADKGNGNYGYIDSLSEARKVLVDQMTGTLITIAKDVKIQVEFNPAQVASYRLIGYENRLLAKEDFNDDTKDAGEIGAGHSVTALYELVPVGVTPPTAPVDDLKYQAPPAAVAGGNDPTPVAGGSDPSSPELLTVKLRYKAPEGTTSQLIEVPVTDRETSLAAATPEFKFTTAVAAYGLMLRQSSYRGNLSWEQIRTLALEGKGNDPHGYRTEFLQLLDKARGLMPTPR